MQATAITITACFFWYWIKRLTFPHGEYNKMPYSTRSMLERLYRNFWRSGVAATLGEHVYKNWTLFLCFPLPSFSSQFGMEFSKLASFHGWNSPFSWEPTAKQSFWSNVSFSHATGFGPKMIKNSNSGTINLFLLFLARVRRMLGLMPVISLSICNAML